MKKNATGFLAIAVFAVFLFSGCSGGTLTETKIGSFMLNTKTTESYADEAVLPSNQDHKLYIIYLTPESEGISMDDMQEFFYPEGDNHTAYISDGTNDYYSISVALESIKTSGLKRMVMVFEIPKSVDTDDLIFRFPK